MNDQILTTRNHSGLSDDVASALAYITIVPAVLLLVVPPYSRRDKVRFHAYQSLFFNATLACTLFAIGMFSAFSQLLESNPSSVSSLGFIWPLRITTVLIWAAVAVIVARGNQFRLPIFAALADRHVAKDSRAHSTPSVSVVEVNRQGAVAA